MISDRELIAMQSVAIGHYGDGPDLHAVARRYVQGRYQRASVLSGPGEPLVPLSVAAEWRQIACLRWAMIEQLTTERDALRATQTSASPEGAKENDHG